MVKDPSDLVESHDFPAWKGKSNKQASKIFSLAGATTFFGQFLYCTKISENVAWICRQFSRGIDSLFTMHWAIEYITYLITAGS